MRTVLLGGLLDNMHSPEYWTGMWDNTDKLEEMIDITKEELKEANEKRAFTLNAEIALGKMKSRLAELKGEKRNIVKCASCGNVIDLDNDFDCWKKDDKYFCMGCGISDFMGVKKQG